MSMPCCAARSAPSTSICGYVREVIGRAPGVQTLAAMNMLMLPDRQIFICDTYVNRQPEPRARSPR